MGTYSKKTLSKLYAWFIQKMGAVPKDRGWVNMTCPFCGAKGKFGVKPITNNVHCFRCGYEGPVIKAVIDILGLDSEKEAWNQVFSDDVNAFNIKVPTGETHINNEVKGIPLPDGYHNIINGSGLVGKACRKYLKNRGFSIAKLSQKGFGYCSTGNYAGYIIIPYYMNDRLVYFNARKVVLGGTTKYKNPIANDIGLGKAYVIYNYEAMFLYKRIQICEGAFNAETIGDTAIATAGKLLTEWQINTIIKSPVEDIDLLLDPDAMIECVELALKLVNFKRVRIVTWEDKKPDGTYKDVNDLGRKETMRRVRRSKFLTYSELINYKIRLLNGERINTERVRTKHPHNEELAYSSN